MSLLHDDEVQAALAAEALGVLEDGPERAVLHARLDADPALRAELDALREAAAALAHAAPVRPLPADRAASVRERLMARAAADRPATVQVAAPEASGEAAKVVSLDAARARRGGGRAGWLAAAASVVLLLATGGYALRLQGEAEASRARVAALEEERAALDVRVAQLDAMLEGLSAPDVRVIDLESADRAAPTGRVYWRPSTNRWVFFANNLPALERGREYQLWLIDAAGEKIPSETFTPGADGRAMLEVEFSRPPSELGAVAVTLEPAGGVPAPTGPVVIVGAMPAATE